MFPHGGQDGGQQEDGEVLERPQYKAFGAPENEPSSDIRARFTGHEQDLDIGLTNMKGRIYDHVLGRFLTPDPVLDPINPTSVANRYAYVGNDPVNRWDPFGFDGEPSDDGDEEDPEPPRTEEEAEYIEDVETGKKEPTHEFDDDPLIGKAPGGDSGQSGNEDEGSQENPEAEEEGKEQDGTDDAGLDASSARSYMTPQFVGGVARDFARTITGSYNPNAVPVSLGRGARSHFPTRDYDAEKEAALPALVPILKAIARFIAVRAIRWFIRGATDKGKGKGKGGRESEKATPKECFVAGTWVLTEDGQKPIEEVVVGDRVWSYDHETGTWVWAAVDRVMVHAYEGELVTIGEGDNSVTATANHPFCVAELSGDERPRPQDIGEDPLRCGDGGRWVEAKLITYGDTLMFSGSGPQPRSISATSGSAIVYNLEVEGTHTYVVGTQRLLVHNKSGVSDEARRTGAGKTGRKINQKRAAKWEAEVERLSKELKSATTKKAKQEIKRQLKHAQTKLKKSESHAIRGQ